MPPKGTTGRDGTVDEHKVAAWLRDEQYRNENVALRSDGSWIGIDVDAYDGKNGDKTLAMLEEELGHLPLTISSTSRGPDQPSRIYYYLVPVGLRFVTRFDGIEIIQHSHRYAITQGSIHPVTGQPYLFYGYEGELLDEFPSIGDVEFLPEAWVERLSIPDDYEEAEGFDGTVAEWLAKVPAGPLGLFMESIVRSIPAEPFGHDQLVSLQARIVTNAAQGEMGAPDALAALRREWLRGEYDTEAYRRDFDVALESAVKKFGSIPDRAEDIPKQDQAAAAAKIKDSEFLDLWMSLPPVVTPDSLRERVARIMSIAFSEGLAPLEAASLGWHSAAAQHPQGPRTGGLEGVWGLLQEVAANPVVKEEQFAAEPEVAPVVDGVKHPLMSEYERSRRASLHWWGDEFMEVMDDLNPVMTEPYYRLNRWFLLSVCFADRAVIPQPVGKNIPLNFYGGMLGPSNTGKTDSMNPVIEMGKMIWELDTNPDIGGVATTSGLTRTLIAHSGQPTLFHVDEADITLRRWADGSGPYFGMAHLITEVYTGNVPKVNLSTQQDISGKDADAILNVHMMGIEHRVADAIAPDDWITGFINRYVWAIGESKPTNDDQKMLPKMREGEGGEVGGNSHVWYRKWANAFVSIRQGPLQPIPGHFKRWMEADDDVRVRDVQTQKTLAKIAQNSMYRERLEPTFKRLEKTIWKCAALVAITERRRQIQMNDYLIALEQAEEWLGNILHLVEITDRTPRARQANRLYELIERNGGSMAKTAINRIEEYQGDRKFTDGLIEELMAQGRAEVLALADGAVVRIVRDA